MKINIILPYQESGKNMYRWANEEKEIDFRRDFCRAARCTVSFAACELIGYLSRLSFEVTYGEKTQKDVFNIALTLESESSEDDIFSLIPQEYGIEIHGKGRIGVLYGAYEFLRMQGIRWLNPDVEILPDQKNILDLPEEILTCKADMPLGRGFDFEGILKDSTKLWLWMARNHLNLSTYRPNTAAFQKKLGMSFKMGGHIFERILHPDNIVSGNKTLWDIHRDWYGKEDDHLADDKEKALKTQFCMSNEELLEYLSGQILSYLKTEWYYADRIDVWTFDTWGKTCQCSKCKSLGNSTDQTLHLISYIRAYLDKKVELGELDHNVRLVMCAYEGTSTLIPPTNGIPESLKSGNDYVVFYPINRCYKHHIYDESCSINVKYKKAFEGWDGIPMMIGEYYNVSKFEDLPLLFSNVMIEDFSYYKSKNVQGMTYMHLPMSEWGVRNLTQSLYALLCRKADKSVCDFMDQYFEDRYADQYAETRSAYELIEESSEYATSWRSWSINSILAGLNNWDGMPPSEPLYQDDHLAGNAIARGEEAIELLSQAIEILKDCRRKRTVVFLRQTKTEMPEAKNPVELALQKKDAVIRHYDEDIRLLLYGKSIMMLTVLFLKYYERMLHKLDDGELWQEIEMLSDELAYQLMPFNYSNSVSNVEVKCEDMLERSQLRNLYFNCKRYRENVYRH